MLIKKSCMSKYYSACTVVKFRFLVSKETVERRVGGKMKQKFGFIKPADKV